MESILEMIKIMYEFCDNCEACIEICPANVYLRVKNVIQVGNEALCAFCGYCLAICQQNAIQHEYLNYL